MFLRSVPGFVRSRSLTNPLSNRMKSAFPIEADVKNLDILNMFMISMCQAPPRQGSVVPVAASRRRSLPGSLWPSAGCKGSAAISFDPLCLAHHRSICETSHLHSFTSLNSESSSGYPISIKCSVSIKICNRWRMAEGLKSGRRGLTAIKSIRETIFFDIFYKDERENLPKDQKRAKEGKGTGKERQRESHRRAPGGKKSKSQEGCGSKTKRERKSLSL